MPAVGHPGDRPPTRGTPAASGAAPAPGGTTPLAPGGTAPPVPVSTAFLLVGLGRVVREDVEAALRVHGLSLRHLSALGHLSREPGLSYSELARRAGVTAQSMQATLRQLEDRGAVERATLPGRGRTAELHVTAAGADLLRAGQGAFGDVDRQLLADVPPEDHDRLRTLLLRAFGSAARRRAPAPAPRDVRRGPRGEDAGPR